MSAVSDSHSATDEDAYDDNTDTNKGKQPENNDGTYQSCSGFYPPRRKKARKVQHAGNQPFDESVECGESLRANGCGGRYIREARCRIDQRGG
jgi:hypothetical protein